MSFEVELDVNGIKPIKNNKELALQILLEKESLVFEGGGILGIAHSGALIKLYELGYKSTKSLIGSSAGSIIAMGLVSGADVKYITATLFKLDFNSFEDGGNIFKKIWRLFTRYGINEGVELETFIGNILKDLYGDSEITFRESYNIDQKHLTVTYLSIKDQKTKYADYINTPNTKIKDAVKRSSTIPLFFEPVRIYGKSDTNGCIKKRKLVDLVVDGGVLDNYPIHVAKEQGYDPIKILGFKLVNDNTKDPKKTNPNKIHNIITNPELFKDTQPLDMNIKKYSMTLIDMLRSQALRYHVHKDDWKISCKINVGNYNSTDFDLTDEEKMWLFCQGYTAVEEHLIEIEKLLDEGLYNFN